MESRPLDEKAVIRRAKLAEARKKRHDQLAGWLKAHPLAWSGWPTTNALDDEVLRRGRARRLFTHGCPPKLAREVDAADRIIAELRARHRKSYQSSIERM